MWQGGLRSAERAAPRAAPQAASGGASASRPARRPPGAPKAAPAPQGDGAASADSSGAKAGGGKADATASTAAPKAAPASHGDSVTSAASSSGAKGGGKAQASAQRSPSSSGTAARSAAPSGAANSASSEASARRTALTPRPRIMGGGGGKAASAAARGRGALATPTGSSGAAAMASVTKGRGTGKGSLTMAAGGGSATTDADVGEVAAPAKKRAASGEKPLPSTSQLESAMPPGSPAGSSLIALASVPGGEGPSVESSAAPPSLVVGTSRQQLVAGQSWGGSENGGEESIVGASAQCAPAHGCPTISIRSATSGWSPRSSAADSAVVLQEEAADAASAAELSIPMQAEQQAPAPQPAPSVRELAQRMQQRAALAAAAASEVTGVPLPSSPEEEDYEGAPGLQNLLQRVYDKMGVCSRRLRGHLSNGSVEGGSADGSSEEEGRRRKQDQHGDAWREIEWLRQAVVSMHGHLVVAQDKQRLLEKECQEHEALLQRLTGHMSTDFGGSGSIDASSCAAPSFASTSTPRRVAAGRTPAVATPAPVIGGGCASNALLRTSQPPSLRSTGSSIRRASSSPVTNARFVGAQFAMGPPVKSPVHSLPLGGHAASSSSSPSVPCCGEGSVSSGPSIRVAAHNAGCHFVASASTSMAAEPVARAAPGGGLLAASPTSTPCGSSPLGACMLPWAPVSMAYCSPVTTAVTPCGNGGVGFGVAAQVTLGCGPPSAQVQLPNWVPPPPPFSFFAPSPAAAPRGASTTAAESGSQPRLAPQAEAPQGAEQESRRAASVGPRLRQTLPLTATLSASQHEAQQCAAKALQRERLTAASARSASAGARAQRMWQQPQVASLPPSAPSSVAPSREASPRPAPTMSPSPCGSSAFQAVPLIGFGSAVALAPPQRQPPQRQPPCAGSALPHRAPSPAPGAAPAALSGRWGRPGSARGAPALQATGDVPNMSL